MLSFISGDNLHAGSLLRQNRVDTAAQCVITLLPKKETSTREVRHYTKPINPNLANQAASQTQEENNNFGILYCDQRMTQDVENKYFHNNL